jgi:hypothetical protein
MGGSSILYVSSSRLDTGTFVVQTANLCKHASNKSRHRTSIQQSLLESTGFPRLGIPRKRSENPKELISLGVS